MSHFSTRCNEELSLAELASTACEAMELAELGSSAGGIDEFDREYAAWCEEHETPVTAEELDRLFREEMERREREGNDHRTPPPAAAVAAPAPVVDAVRLTHKQFRRLMVVAYAGLRGRKVVVYRGKRFHSTEYAGWVELTPAA